MLRCSVTALVTGIEEESGFRELVRRVGRDKARDSRFGKGFSEDNEPLGERLEALAIHACGGVRGLDLPPLPRGRCAQQAGQYQALFASVQDSAQGPGPPQEHSHRRLLLRPRRSAAPRSPPLRRLLFRRHGRGRGAAGVRRRRGQQVVDRAARRDGQDSRQTPVDRRQIAAGRPHPFRLAACARAGLASNRGVGRGGLFLVLETGIGDRALTVSSIAL